ncbi:MAG: GNAT family N-acetyltransferase [Planctomycetes bacterium]|nr:GNAT family N-acetyltransferase [Planctomycetota bacterium]
MNLNIRPARPSDAERIAELNRRLAKETENKDLDGSVLGAGVAAVLADPRKGRYFVAETNASPGSIEVIGQLGVTCEWSDWRNGNFWWIQSVYVVQAGRRLGVFRALYEHLLREARSQPDVIGVRLYVEHDNHVAQATYKKLGMALTGYQVMEVYPLHGARGQE